MTSVTTIQSLQARIIRVPLARPWGAEVSSVAVIATQVELSDETRGWGFSWTPQIGAESVLALLQHDIAQFAKGRDADPGELWDQCWTHLHEAGSGGLTTIALAGLDLALWDALARRRGMSVSEFIGRRRDSARVYGSGVNLHYSLEELLSQVARWIDSGFQAVKIKVGKPDLAEDVDRVTAVRELLGPARELMLDANQRWDLSQASRATDAFASMAPSWIEEPLRADDLASHIELSKRTAVPIALGENLHTIYRFEEYMAAGAAQVIQPNIVRVGGITPFRRIATAARERAVGLHPHLLPELSGQLALTLAGSDSLGPWVEDVEDAGFSTLGALTDPSPVIIESASLTERPHRGLGMKFR